MGKYQAYPEYKDSGVEWLGNIPDDWEILDGKRMFKNIRIPAFADDKQLAASQNLMMQLNDSKVMLALKGTDSFKHVDSDDFVISLRSFEGGIEHSKYAGCVSPAYTVLRASRTLAPSYYRYLFKSKPYISALQSSTDSLRDGKSITYDQFGLIKLVIPSIDEQQKIATFLDHETAKIDALIEQQQQLIQLLKEKRQAVISHAVTKGLNPNAPMKDSGIEWLGEVPAHWEVKRLKQIAELQSGIAKGKDNSDRSTIDVPMLRVANVQDGYFDLSEVDTIDIEPSNLSRYLLRNGDVLMNEGGDNDKLGRGAVWRSQIEPCIHQNHVFAIRPFDVEPEWLELVTRSSYAKFHFYRVAKQSTNLASISSTNIKETPLTLPPLKERLEILSYINEKLEAFDKLESSSFEQISLMQERRTALISAAVTGKIDVRNFAEPATR
jgi:type I restriction enzyme S subunit